MYWQRARHPRAGAAIGAVILASWLALIGIDLASGSSPDPGRAPAPGAVAIPPQVAPAPGVDAVAAGVPRDRS